MAAVVAGAPTPLTTWSMVPALRLTVMMWCRCTPGRFGTSKPFAVWIDGLFWLKTYTPPPYRWWVRTRSPTLYAAYPSFVPSIQSAWVGGSYGSSFWKKIVVPRSPFQTTLLRWKCSTNRPVAVTLSPLTTTPLRPMLVRQRSVSPPVKPSPPWSARHTQVWSTSTLSLLISSATSVLPTCGPPTRKYTSDSVVGFEAELWSRPYFDPTSNSVADWVLPASTVTPATTAPWTLPISIGVAPLAAVSVAWPRPSTTWLERLTRMLCPTLYTPGVSSRFLPRARAASTVRTESVGLAT